MTTPSERGRIVVVGTMLKEAHQLADDRRDWAPATLLKQEEDNYR